LDWHVFSYRVRPCLEGDAALNAYRQKGTHQELYVLSATDNAPDLALMIEVSAPPDLTRLNIDASVIPVDFSWTMTFTHERGLHGPYFCDQPANATNTRRA
jgi:tRNA (guanine-N7-)-methyltransferase